MHKLNSGVPPQENVLHLCVPRSILAVKDVHTSAVVKGGQYLVCYIAKVVHWILKKIR